MAAIVTDDFLQGATWNSSRLDRYSENIDTVMRQVARLQSNVGNLTRLENEDCIRAYGTNGLQSKWKNVLVVSDANVTGPLIIGYYHQAEFLDNDLGWICGNQAQVAYNQITCDTKPMLSHPTNWTIADIELNQKDWAYRRTMWSGRWDDVHPQGPYFSAAVKYCLAETAEQYCTLQISIPLLGVVLLCNLIKVMCLSSALLIRSFHPLTTVGDLISSCLSEPDPHTRGMGPITAKDVRKSKAVRLLDHETLVSRLLKDYRAIYFERSTSLLSDYTNSDIPMVRGSSTATDVVEKSSAAPVEWKKQKTRWYKALSRSSWVACVVLCVIAWFTGVYLLTNAINYRKDNMSQTYTLSRMWQDGVGAVSTDFLIGGDHERPLIENVLLANTPQLAISFVYILYNNCLTRMMLAREYSSYASNRKPLRVSRPEGEQRSTYRLQLPYRYSVPLMATMTVLHWLVARSIFLVDISVINYDGDQLISRISGCGFSAMAIVLSLFVSGAIILALLASSARRLDSSMPLASSCSLTITAACHTSPGDENAALLPVKYGVVIADEPESESGCEHACFSSKEVTPLVDGHWYN